MIGFVSEPVDWHGRKQFASVFKLKGQLRLSDIVTNERFARFVLGRSDAQKLFWKTFKPLVC